MLRELGFVKEKRKRGRTRIELIALIGVWIYFFYSILTSQGVSIGAKAQQIESIKKEIQQEEQYRATLKDVINDANTDEYTKNVARQQLGMLQNNERVFIDSNK